MLIEASQTEEHRNHHSVLCMRHSVRNIEHPGSWCEGVIHVTECFQNLVELHKSINLHITRTATVTLWELVS